MSLANTSQAIRYTGSAETVISAGPCKLAGVVFNNGSASSITVRDASVTASGVTPNMVLDTTRATGGTDTKFATYSKGLTVVGGAAGTDVTFFITPIL
jgi:Ni,Fe-hydrogenase III small subunit